LTVRSTRVMIITEKQLSFGIAMLRTYSSQRAACVITAVVVMLSDGMWIVCARKQNDIKVSLRFMMKMLRGRNLAHPGCLIGVILGTIFGIVLAGVLALTTHLSYTAVTLSWFGLIFLLGLIGWIIGTILTPKFPALDEQSADAVNTTSSTQTDASH